MNSHVFHSMSNMANIDQHIYETICKFQATHQNIPHAGPNFVCNKLQADLGQTRVNTLSLG